MLKETLNTILTNSLNNQLQENVADICNKFQLNIENVYSSLNRETQYYFQYTRDDLKDKCFSFIEDTNNIISILNNKPDFGPSRRKQTGRKPKVTKMSDIDKTIQQMTVLCDKVFQKELIKIGKMIDNEFAMSTECIEFEGSPLNINDYILYKLNLKTEKKETKKTKETKEKIISEKDELKKENLKQDIDIDFEKVSSEQNNQIVDALIQASNGEKVENVEEIQNKLEELNNVIKSDKKGLEEGEIIEEYEEQEIEVEQIIINGKDYYIDDDNKLYDIETSDIIGILNKESGEITKI